jgi:hypothetical protein
MNSQLKKPMTAIENFGKVRRITPPFFATTAIAFFIYATLALLLLHVLRPDYALRNHMISDYAVGRYGWVMTTWFIAMSCGCLMLMLGLARSGLNSVLSWIGTVLLSIASFGMLISAFFPTDIEGAPSTRTGDIHNLSFFVNVVSIILSMAFLTVSFRSHPWWRAYQGVAIALTSIVVIAFFIQFFTLHRGAPYGLTNRLFVIVLFVWLFATSIRLRRLTRK